MANFRSDFHLGLAQMFLQDIQYERAKYYYFLGKVEDWQTAGVPDTPPDAQSDDALLRSNMVYVKKISTSDVSLATTNYTWATGTVYDKWNHTDSMRLQDGTPKPFYCVTSDYRVYKCLDNANGAPSTVQPFGTSTEPNRLADSYLWKYMYTMPAVKKEKFLTGTHMPVQRSLTDNFYNNGEVAAAIVKKSGTGYPTTASTAITLSGGTLAGSGAVITFTRNVTTGAVATVSVSNGGTGYTKGVRLKINTTFGTGAVLTPVIVGGIITDVEITSPGYGYGSGDTISVLLGQAVLIPKINAAGSIVGVTIKDPGIGYATAPTLTVTGTGTNKFVENNGVGKAILTAVVSGGTISLVSISDPGIGYGQNSTTTITVQGDGTGCLMSPVVYNGKIIDVVIDAPGSGYTYTIITTTGGTTPAEIVGVLDESDFTSDQSVVEQTTVPGAIYSLGITSGGLGYENTPTLTITGDGVGATASCIINDAGTITGVTVTNFGSGYSYANVSVTPVGAAPSAAATLYAIMPPPGGHGSDAPHELLADVVAFNTSLREPVIELAIDQDYRQYGIIKNPYNVDNFTLADTDSSAIVYQVEFNNTTGLVVDETLITGANETYRVIYKSSNTVWLSKLNQTGTLEVNDVLTSSNGLRNYTVIAITTTPTINKFSGNILYVANEAPFTFTTSNFIVIKTFIKF